MPAREKPEETAADTVQPTTYFENVKFPIVEQAGTFTTNEREFDTLEKAKAYRVKLIEAEAEAEAADLSDIIPEGWEVEDRTLEFRNNILELPMNETHLPDGSLNPWYDRTWVWIWAADRATDVTEKQARRYQLVSFDELKELAKTGDFPEHYLNLIRAEGSYVVYGDLVLMRLPRFLRRQRQEEADRKVMDRFKKQDEEIQSIFDNAGMRQSELPFRNTVEVNYNPTS